MAAIPLASRPPNFRSAQDRPWRLVWRIIAFRPGLFGLALLFSVLAFGLPIATGLVLQAFFDALTGRAALGPGVAEVLALFVVVQAADALAGAGLSFFWGSTLFTGTALVRRNLLRAVLGRDGRHELSGSTGEALSRFRDDVDTVVDSIDAWIDLVGRTIFGALALWIMLRIDAGVTLAVVPPFLVAIAVVTRLGWRTEALRRANRAALGRVTGFMGDLFAGVQALKVGGAIPHAVGHLERLNESRRRAAVRDRAFDELLDAFSANVDRFAVGAVLLLAAQSLRSGSPSGLEAAPSGLETAFSVGDFALFALYLRELVWLPDEVIRWLRGNRQSAVSIERMRKVVGRDEASWLPAQALVEHGRLDLRSGVILEPVVPPPRDRLELFEARGLTCRYPGSGRGIEGVDLRIEPGTVTVVTGRIGAGKTTLLHALLGLLPREEGELRWNGRPLEEPSALLGPPRTAFTPQLPRLFSETLRENVLQGLVVEPARLAAALRSAVLEGDVERLERRLETVIGPRGTRLSGGQLQRAAAARMFVREPELLVFDDLSSALDVETERELWERLAERTSGAAAGSSGAAVLAVSHRRAALRRADQIVVLVEGRVADRGRLGELLDRCEELRRIWAGQVG